MRHQRVNVQIIKYQSVRDSGSCKMILSHGTLHEWTQQEKSLLSPFILLHCVQPPERFGISFCLKQILIPGWNKTAYLIGNMTNLS